MNKNDNQLSIDVRTLWSGRDDSSRCYFHPRPTLNSDKGLMMCIQRISGSDYFHPVMETFSDHLNSSWSEPKEIPSLGRVDLDDGIIEGVCDVVPTYHPKSKTTIVIGHNVYYKDGRLFDSMGDWSEQNVKKKLRRYPLYSVKSATGEWVVNREKLVIPDLIEKSIYSCGCSQSLVLEQGDFLIPITFGEFGRKDRMVCSIKCTYDGSKLEFQSMSNVLEKMIGRGLLEPSLCSFQSRFYMTIRAEDNHGYLAVSDDGDKWEAFQRWVWDDGQEIHMSTTQQHFLELSGKLFLVYTRKDPANINVMRWRAPLYIAEVDTNKLCLIKGSEQVVFEMRGDGVNDPDGVALMGNFHPLKITENSGMVTVGEMLPAKGYRGNTLQAVITLE